MGQPSNRVKEVFLGAIDERRPEQWPAFLDQACDGDVQLRGEVEKLLRAQEAMGSFHEAPRSALSDTVDHPIREQPGTIIGPYKLLTQIGEGGMGVVYLAEQDKPVRRRVALKIIKPGMDTIHVIARFESERQALALMDHRNIAKVLDAGATDSGRPYFVMELVQGGPITQFCDRNQLALEARLRLFLDVCQAIQHAHYKGVIHRDIKPTNVLVTLDDGVPVPKVIDFGIAKATAEKLTEWTLLTAHGEMIGTPAYMSPEQAESGLDIDTRTDVYSLGVLLYELLTGTTPLESTELREAGYAEIQRLIREEEAPRPSTRLSSLGDSATVTAANRGLDVKRLTQLLAGDLNWVVMKALEKDRNRRYQTPGSFAEDIGRYLRHEAVQARPPSLIYKVRKFARRNRAAVLTGSALAAALLVGAMAATWQAFVATRAKQDALAAAAAEKAAKELAQVREADTEAVLKFVERQVLTAARPKGHAGGQGPEVTLRKAVESALPFVEKSFPNQPLIEARLRMTLGKSFLDLREAAIAAEQFQAARALYATHLGPDHAETLRSMHHLAKSYRDLGRYKDALALEKETLEKRRATLGPDHPDTLCSVSGVASCYAALGLPADVVKLREETLALMKAKFGPDDPKTLQSMHNLATSYADQGRQAEALALREKTLALCKAKLEPDDPDTLRSMNALAVSYDDLGRRPEAMKLFEEVLEKRKARLGPDHPDTLVSMSNLANSYSVLGRHAEALKLYDEALASLKTKLGPDHPDTFQTMYNLAICYVKVGRQADALALRQESLALHKAKLSPEHPRTLMAMNSVANSYFHLERYAEAAKLYEETVALQKAKVGPDHPDTLQSMCGLVESLAMLGRSAEAVPIIDECVRQLAGKTIQRDLLQDVLGVRLRHFAKARDAAGCRQTAEMWESCKATDAESLYLAARMRAVTASVLRAAGKQADAEAGQAIAWLTQAIAAGYKNAPQLKKDKDLDALRDRADFAKLVTMVEGVQD
jgi:serine/threonine protein kinase/tetratricopeptide (TPR) repeat protein